MAVEFRFWILHNEIAGTWGWELHHADADPLIAVAIAGREGLASEAQARSEVAMIQRAPVEPVT